METKISTKTIDITVYANGILSLVKACPVGYKENVLIDILVGSKRKTLPQNLVQSEYYRIYGTVTRDHLKMCFQYLLDFNLLVTNKKSGLMLTENGQKWLTISNPSFVISVSLPTEIFVPINSEIKAKKEKKTNGNKIPSYLQSYKLFQFEGNTVEQIAAIRNLAISTVETHLIECVKRGLDLDVSRLGFNDYKLKFITNIINSIFWEDYSKIKPIKEECDRLTDIDCDDDKLPLIITYFDIKYTIALMDK